MADQETAQSAEQEALPDHQDFGDPCPHRPVWEAVTTHTRTVNGIGPDHCAECSDSVKEWVRWPCSRASASAEGAKRTLVIDADAMAAALTDPELAAAVLARVDAAAPENRQYAATQAIAHLVNAAARKAVVR